MNVNKFFLPLLAMTFFLLSCDKDDDTPLLSGDVKDFKYVNATSYTGWTYFSFEKGDTIQVQDPENDLSWDIAFHRYDIKLNGGKSGAGKGEACNTHSTDWNAIIQAPKSGYQKDELGMINSSWTEKVEAPFSQVLAAWITSDTSNPPPVYTYHDWIFVIKSASGKYVKLYIYDYMNEKNTGAYISFKYQYNESGSDSFEE